MIETDIFDALGDLVSGRCYPLQMPQSPTYPCIVYARISSNPQNRIEGGASLDQVRVQVDCYDLTYTGAKTLCASVRSAMEGAAFKATLQFDTDLYEPEVKVYRVMMDFYVWQQNT
jgi:hypothetical protein